jgi:hypothetical protein
VGKLKKCLVETYENLIAGAPGDPVRKPFDRLCPSSKMWSNPGMDYAGKLKESLKKSEDRALTHTGNRHIAPFGRIYPNDFPIPTWAVNWVDLDPKGSISGQLPEKFLQAKRSMRSVVTFALDDLLIQQLSDGLAKLGAVPSAPALAALEDRLAKLLSAEALRFQPGESARHYELARIRESFAHHQGFMTLLDHKTLKPESVRALLRSPELPAFLGRVRPGKYQLVYFRGGENMSASVGELQFTSRGLIYLVGTSAADPARQELLWVDPETSEVLTRQL